MKTGPWLSVLSGISTILSELVQVWSLEMWRSLAGHCTLEVTICILTERSAGVGSLSGPCCSVGTEESGSHAWTSVLRPAGLMLSNLHHYINTRQAQANIYYSTYINLPLLCHLLTPIPPQHHFMANGNLCLLAARGCL